MFKSEEIEIKERGYLDIEIDPTLDLFEEIKKLKKEIDDLKEEMQILRKPQNLLLAK